MGRAAAIGGRGCMGSLYSEVQCIIGNGQTDTTENITFPQLRWCAVRLPKKATVMTVSVVKTRRMLTVRVIDSQMVRLR